MNNLRFFFAILIIAFPLGSLYERSQATTLAVAAVASAQPQSSSSSPSAAMQASSDQAAQATEKTITAYTLPPDLARKAHLLGQLGFMGRFIGFFYAVLVLVLFLKWKLAPKFRNWAEQLTSNKFLQAAIFSPLCVISIGVLHIPFDAFFEWVVRKFGLSVQSWPSWLADWAKGELITAVIGTIAIFGLYEIIHRSPRRWWFYFWLGALPVIPLLVLMQPLIIDPMFHKFEPLEQKNPALTLALEKMVEHAGEAIPPERMFWMGAAEKTTELNAYVTGLGASKRIVVWDTTIAKMNTPQIVFVAGHEMGHYVLHHVPRGIAFGYVGLFVLFYLGFRCIGWVLARWGGRWAIRSLDDWASFPALFLLITIFSFIGSPIESTFSRYIEHQADQYGLEVTHGLTPNSSQVAAQAFQVLGEVDLADPDPNPINVLLFYDHPAIPDRIHFCLTYDPWADGGQPEFVH
jgi:STE24 endopeptidase